MKPAKDEFRTSTGLMGWTALFAGRCSDVFAEIDGQIVLLLGGSGKRNQDREIAKARARLKDIEQRTK